jgi:hypothetical protein
MSNTKAFSSAAAGVVSSNLLGLNNIGVEEISGSSNSFPHGSATISSNHASSHFGETVLSSWSSMEEEEEEETAICYLQEAEKILEGLLDSQRINILINKGSCMHVCSPFNINFWGGRKISLIN